MFGSFLLFPFVLSPYKFHLYLFTYAGDQHDFHVRWCSCVSCNSNTTGVNRGTGIVNPSGAVISSKPWDQLPIRTMGRHIYPTQSLRTTTYQDYGTTYISHPISENNYLSGLWDDIYIPPHPCEQLPIRTMGRHIYPTPSLRTTTYQDYGTTYISHPIPENNYLSGLWDDIHIPPNPWE
jgi:hypothetical protein